MADTVKKLKLLNNYYFRLGFNTNRTAPIEVENDCKTISSFDITTLPTTTYVLSGFETLSDFCTVSPLSATTIDATFSFPNLTEISGKDSASSSLDATFGIAAGSKFKTLVFGPSLENINSYGIGTVQTLILNCPNCNLNEDWYISSTPITTIVFADEWKGDLDLTIAASDRNAAYFADLVENKLYDFLGSGDEPFLTTNAHVFKIPEALLSTELANACSVKGWTLVGGE